ncbi:MAG: MlaD family protein [Candidatus Binatia bacterium]
MATEVHKFQVGVFVIVATVIAVATVIWLGASRFFESTQPFVTYFSESVQGLEPGSALKYRGVPSGRVRTIRIAPDGELIEVLLDVDTRSAQALKKDPTLRATLELSGITGLRYIEIDRRTGEALNQAPTLSFKPPYEVISSSRSSFKAIQVALEDVYNRIMQVDFGGISSDARTTLQAANTLLRDERIDALLTNFKALSLSTSQLAKNLETMTNGVQLGPAVDNATKATAEARALLTDLRSGAGGKQLSATFEQLDRIADTAQQVLTGLQYTIERLDRSATSLQSLTEQVRSQPSLLLFSEPPTQRHGADGGKP